MIKVGVIGGAGYTAGELLRILIHHPDVEIVFVHSSSNAGNALVHIHSGLIGETEHIFTSELPLESVDVLFLCSAHGDSKKFIEENVIPQGLKIIDLSTDYRAKSADHEFIYGLPELNREKIKKSYRLANPGCFATAIQLALLPLASEGLLKSDIHINAITGSTGAGIKPTATSHFSWRNNNISIYKPFEHQHLQEITQSIKQIQEDFNNHLNFIPVRGNFTRGIFVTSYTQCALSAKEAEKLYRNYYNSAAFCFVTDQNPDLKQVVNTNKAVIYLEKHNNILLIVSLIDNLLKGASGQAVQNMNLMFDLKETTGLNLKATGF